MSVPGLVSVVIPAFNCENHIEQTLASVALQTYKNLEIIIVDDCSTDSTFDVCLDYARRVSNCRVIQTQKNFGCPGGPRNLGVRESKGDFIAFLDSDDLWHERKLELQMKLLLDLEADFVSSEMQSFAANQGYDCNKSLEVTKRFKKISYWAQAFNYQTPTSSVVVRKSIMEANEFEEGLNFKAREDIDCWLRIHRVIGASHKVQVPLLGYRVSDHQISGNKFKMISRTYYCYRHSKGLRTRLFGILPLVLTISHSVNSVYKRYAGRSV